MPITLGNAYLPLFRQQRDPFILVEGRRGTGKTRAILSIILSRALQCRPTRWILARSARTRLSSTVLVTLEDEVFPAFGMEVPGGKISKDHRTEYVLPGGSVLQPMGLDDEQRTQSGQCAGIYVAEGIELSRQEQVTALAGPMRQPIAGGPQCIVDCNPGPPAHWLNQIAEDVDPTLRRVRTLADYRRLCKHNLARVTQAGRWKRIITCHWDNPGYMDAATGVWTPLGSTYMATLNYLTGHLRRRWLDGEWVAAEGTVYPEFDESLHVVDDPIILPHWPVYVGWDPGYDHPTAILWIAVADDGTLIVFDEIYEGGKGVSSHAANLLERSAGRNVRQVFADPQYAFSRTAHNAKTIAEQAAECGVRMAPWPRTASDELAMIEAVRQHLVNGRLLVSRRCKNTIAEFQSWRWQRSRAGDMGTGNDNPEDRDNDAMDVIKGLVSAGISRRTVEMVRPAGMRKVDRRGDNEDLEADEGGPTIINPLRLGRV